MLKTVGRTVFFGVIAALCCTTAVNTAYAKSIKHGHSAGYRRHATAGAPRVIQCVAFAKQYAGIVIPGNARDWWYNAAGTYERGHAPEVGSVLSFTENGRMPLGHVAVVSGVVDSRTIVIDQAHWNSRGITRDITVKDVSENNDWTAVRVELARSGSFGSIYPTHGFIYARPDSGRIVTASTRAPMPDLDPAPTDLRRTLRRHRADDAALEVAEAPSGQRGLDLSVPGLLNDGPDRGVN